MTLPSDDVVFALAALLAAISLAFPWVIVLAFAILAVPVVRSAREGKDRAASEIDDKVYSAAFQGAAPGGGSPEASPTAAQAPASPEITGKRTAARQRSVEGKTDTDAEEGGPPDFGPREARSVISDWGNPTLRVLDENKRVLKVNSEEPVPIENEHFKGVFLLMLRVEDPQLNRYAHHFQGRQRKFEVQIQGQFKTPVNGVLYMGGELTRKLQLSIVARTVTSMVMRFCAKLVNNMRYSFGEDADESGEYEVPHIVFPLYRAMDRVVETPPSEEPPQLGRELPEPDEHRNLRRAGKTPDIQWKTGVTYSFSFHSMYIDFATWNLVNIPGYKSIDMRTFIGDQTPRVVVYDIQDDGAGSSKTKHTQSRKNYFLVSEFAHISMLPEEELLPPELDTDEGLEFPPSHDEHETSSGEEEEEEDAEVDEGHPTHDTCEEETGRFVRTNVVATVVAVPCDGKGEPNMAAIDIHNPAEPSWPCVADSGGFAVVKEFRQPQGLMLLKVTRTPKGRARRRSSDMQPPVDPNSPSSKIRIGDTVMVQNASTGRYLTIYRGWWLGWSETVPRSSKAQFVVLGDYPPGTCLDFDMPFRLRSRKWQKFEVGVYVDRSAEHGGRLLAIYQTSSKKRGSIRWKNGTYLNPLYLSVPSQSAERALSIDNAAPRPTELLATLEEDGQLAEKEYPEILRAQEDLMRRYQDIPPPTTEFSAAVTGWVEMLHRTTRHPQLAYIVLASTSDAPDARRWVSLRTGKDLSRVLEVVFSPAASSHKQTRVRSFGRHKGGGSELQPGSFRSDSLSAQCRPLQHQNPADQSVRMLSLRISSILANEIEAIQFHSPIAGSHVVPSTSAQALSTLGEADTSERYLMHSPRRASASTSLVESPTNGTDKRPVSQHSSATRPSVNSECSEDDGGDNDEGADQAKEEEENGGEGDARQADAAALRMAVLPGCALPARERLHSMLKKPQIFDTWFLRGGAAEIGVTVTSKMPHLHQCLVARCLWESHWREELAVLYPTHISFYAPLSRKPVWVLPLADLIKVRVMQRENPLPGLFVLCLECLGRCHYVCFSTPLLRDVWASAIMEQLGTSPTELPAGIIVSDPRENFVLKETQWKPANRIVLNARRAAFDVQPPSEPFDEFSQRLLREVFALQDDDSRESERLMAFLDSTAALKHIDLSKIDFGKLEALVFFVNIYHTMLQHGRLILGHPTSQNWGLFFSSVSYEIGGDVFSLVELEQCVIRGSLSRPKALPRNFPAMPSAVDDHYMYSLTISDQRLNFLLNNGSISNPPVIFLLTTSNLYDKMTEAAQLVLTRTMKVDVRRRTVSLPKVCDIYRGDFGEDPHVAIRHCLRYLEREQWEMVSAVLNDKPPHVRFHSLKCQSHETLTLRE